MIQSIAAPNGGTVIYRTMGRARRKARTGMYGLVVVALIAGSGAVVSGVQSQLSMEARNVSPDMLPPGPFSYFPR